MCSQITPNNVNSNCVTGENLIFTTIENWYRIFFFRKYDHCTFSLLVYQFVKIILSIYANKKILNKITTFSLHCCTVLLQGPQVTVKPADAVYVQSL